MSTYQPVTVDAAKQIAEHFAKSIVVITAFDSVHDLIHVTTYGVDAEDKITASQLGERLAEAAGLDFAKKESFEDFRTVDAAERAREIEELRDFVRHWIAEWDSSWIDPTDVNHEWADLYRRAKELVSPDRGELQCDGGPDHGN